MARRPDDHDDQDTSSLEKRDVENPRSYENDVHKRHVERLRQASRYRTILFYGTVGALVVLVALTVAIIVGVVWRHIVLPTGALAVFVGGLTAQIVSIVLVISRSVFPSDSEDFKAAKLTEEPKTRRGQGDGAERALTTAQEAE